MFSFWSGSKGKPMCSLARSHLPSCMHQQVMSSAFQGPLLGKHYPGELKSLGCFPSEAEHPTSEP